MDLGHAFVHCIVTSYIKRKFLSALVITFNYSDSKAHFRNNFLTEFLDLFHM